MQRRIIQGSTLLLFCSLIVGFVGYRSGWFSSESEGIPMSPNGSVINANQPNPNANEKKKDTTKKQIPQTIMPSSKVLIIEPAPNSNDSDRKPDQDLYIDREIMHSTKSAPVFDIYENRELDRTRVLDTVFFTDSTYFPSDRLLIKGKGKSKK